jgi:N-methylhydantoinase A
VLLKAFEVSYQQKFSRTPPSVPVEFINIRVSARAEVASSATRSAERSTSAATSSVRPVFFSDVGKYVDAKVFRRTDLAVGDVHHGPAVIEEDGSTLVIGPAATFEVVPSHNIVVNIS